MNILIDLAFGVLFILLFAALIWGLVYFESRAVSHNQRVIRRAKQ